MKIYRQKISFINVVIIMALCLLFARHGFASDGRIIYFADADESNGSIYKVENSTESAFYTRTSGNLYSFAFSSDNILYYVNANAYKIYKLAGSTETVFYTHTTYVKDVAFDGSGNLYFSQATGAGGDGYIYKLTNGVPSLYYTVKLSYVSTWAGNFAFDKNNVLYLSTGNSSGSKIYRVEYGIPKAVFSIPSSECCIKGINFDSQGNLFYASWSGGNIYQVDLSTQGSQLVYSNPNHTWLSDVWVKNTVKTMTSVSVSGSVSVSESSYADYKATAYFSDGTSQVVTSSAVWSENSSYAYMDSLVKGRLKTYAVTSNQTVTVSASYTYGGVTKSSSMSVIIKDKTLTSVSVTGSSTVNGNSYANYTATAYFSDGTSQNVTASTTWSENSSYAYFDSYTKGKLITQTVTSYQYVTLTASYTYSGITKSGTKSVTITSPPPTCTYSISPTSKQFTSSGGTGSVSVTASATTCSRTALSYASWITITSGSSGTGSGTVYYSVAANTGTSDRIGTMTIAGKTFTVTQTSKTPTSVSISGYSTVNESSYTAYTATAYFSDSTSQNITSSAIWSENSSYAYFDSYTKGKLITQAVTSDQYVTLTASYTYSGVTKSVTKTVTIVNIAQSNVWHTGISQTRINVRGNPVVVGQLTVNVPAAGKVLVHFDGKCHPSYGDTIALAASNQADWGVNDGNVSVSDNEGNFSHTRMYYIAQGSNTFYAVAQNYVNESGTGIASIYGSLSVEFFPNGNNLFVSHTGISKTRINVRGNPVTVGQLTVNAPSAGKVLVRFDGQCVPSYGDTIVLAASNQADWEVNDGNVSVSNSEGSFSHTRMYDIAQGSHTFYAVAENYVDVSGTGIASIYGSLSVEFFPNGNNAFVSHTGISETRINVRGNPVTVGQLTVNAPSAGKILVHFDGFCSPSYGDRIVLAASNQADWEVNDGNVSVSNSEGSFSHTRMYDVVQGSNTFYAVAENYVEESGSGITSIYGSLSIKFFPK